MAVSSGIRVSEGLRRHDDHQEADDAVQDADRA